MMAGQNGKFTGKHMALVMVGGFGVVIAVNLVMASFAVGSFHGTVVDSSYVASQKFNGWMEEARQVRSSGWKVTAKRVFGGQVQITTTGVPPQARIEAYATRPVGESKTVIFTFVEESAGRWISNETIDQGRWDLRLVISDPNAKESPSGFNEIVPLK
jgi:nitrogen fixation protein FixH